MISWDDLHLVLAVARAGTLPLAARALGVHHSTVFRRLKALEEDASRAFFERQGNRLVPTATGEAVIAAATSMEDAALGLDRALRGEEEALVGEVRFTTTATLMPLLTRHLRRFCEQYPRVSVSLLLDNRSYALHRLEADVALRPGPRPRDEALVVRRLSRLAATLYASPDYLERHGHPDTAEAWEGHGFVGSDAALAQLSTERWRREHAGEAPLRVRSNHLTGHVTAARAGLGIIAMYCFLADPYDDLVRVAADPIPEMASELWLVLHRDLRQTARVRAFVSFLVEAVHAERGRLEAR